MFKNLFSFDGRIRRTEYGISMIITGFISASISAIMESIGEDAVIFAFLYIPLMWFAWSQAAKRCHDLGNSGWWQLIPFYGLWLLFQDGQYGDNEYGSNPKGISTNMVGNSYNSTVSNTSSHMSNSGYSGGYNGGHNSSNQGGINNQNGYNRSSGSSDYKEGDLYK
ncbi:DUF805 domain-containing protein [Myroides marinus]|uniref:DUF805 domain-containing protein n=1 Tax=Myroides marinus TaxID=703342 RepID=UPI0025756A89|nr:DUF805 domain-containing protein [Myroides marinus]MDM1361127.1 DUF805 domain-containing protein [Myroides marinus]